MSFGAAGDEELGHTRPFDHLTLIAKGSFEVEVNGERTVYTAPAMVYIRAEYVHRLKALEDGSIAYCIHGLRDLDKSDDPSPSFDNLSPREYLRVDLVRRYEPSLGIDQRERSDAVFCFDVLEHLFIADVPTMVDELFTLADKLLVVNVACYDASALLPCGENAHTTVRPAP